MGSRLGTAGSPVTHCSSSPPSLGAGQPFSVTLDLLGGALGSWKKSEGERLYFLPAFFRCPQGPGGNPSIYLGNSWPNIQEGVGTLLH